MYPETTMQSSTHRSEDRRVGFLFNNGHTPGSEYKRYEKLVLGYQHRVYGFAFYLLGDREGAEDVTQEVLLRLWKHRDGVDEDRVLAWLLRVTRNACMDELRKRMTYHNLVDVDSERVDHAMAGGLAPDVETEQADFQRRLQRALNQVAEPYRSIVILREIQDMKYEDIGDALGLPLNTVKVYLHRGRKMLREQLSEVLERETT